MVKRAGFTFIELIFAIVIIAITAMSLPMMSQILSNNMEKNLVQEAIFAAAAELSDITTLHWDENSIDSNNTNGLADVINLDLSCKQDSLSNIYRLRPGHISQPFHRKCLNNLNQNAANSNTNNSVDAVEDREHKSQNLFINPTPSAKGYKDSYKSTLTIKYSPNFDGLPQPNMKKINIEIENSDGNTIVKLSTYIANIGEVDYYKRSF